MQDEAPGLPYPEALKILEENEQALTRLLEEVQRYQARLAAEQEDLLHARGDRKQMARVIARFLVHPEEDPSALRERERFLGFCRDLEEIASKRKRQVQEVLEGKSLHSKQGMEGKQMKHGKPHSRSLGSSLKFKENA